TVSRSSRARSSRARAARACAAGSPTSSRTTTDVSIPIVTPAPLDVSLNGRPGMRLAPCVAARTTKPGPVRLLAADDPHGIPPQPPALDPQAIARLQAELVAKRCRKRSLALHRG